MEAEARRRRVTVVDDDEDILALMRDIISGLGHEPTTLGPRGLTLTEIADTQPDLLVLDLRLPLGSQQLTGPELLRLVRRHRALKEIPLVMCSADVEGLEGLQGDDADLPDVAFVAKPFDLDTIETVIGSALANGG